MLVTVAICTWNRAQLFDQTLGGMHKLRIPFGMEWELLIVNNNCTDNTDEVIDRHSRFLPIRRLFESKPGKSHALNLAVREAQGEYILWTDDDAFVDENWMLGYWEAFRKQPQATFFGGPVEPIFEGALPEWLQRTWRQVGSAYAARDLGDEPIQFVGGQFPFGVNWAIRTKDQQSFLYDTGLGPRPNSSLRGEEIALLEKIVAEGHEGWWVPDASVRHYTPRSRQTILYLRDYFFGQGEYDGLRMLDTGEPKLFGRPRWLWRQAIEAEIKYRFRRFLTDPEVWIEELKAASRVWGRLRGYASR